MKIFSCSKFARAISSQVTSDKMSTFVQTINPLTGKSSWELEDENYDYYQEIARSMYADMLHDTDRNKKYYLSLKRAIERRHARGEKANVLDIGTGTGLLSMMAAKCKADSIVACEAFSPIAGIAKNVISDNNLSDKIRVVAKRSTELEVGPGKDLDFRANILVTEVFDTELIGEGAIETFNHAKTYLLEADSDVIPLKSRMYAAVVESEFLHYCNRFRTEYPLENGVIKIPDDIVNCPGTNGVHDLQLSQLSLDDFKLLTKPVNIFNFDFGGKMLLSYDNESLIEVTAVENGKAHVVMMWWELDMDGEGIVVTCAPKWIDESSPWRDHWMQAVYHLPKVLTVEKGQNFSLLSCHDEFSLWFNIYSTIDEGVAQKGNTRAPVCTCGAHVVTSRTRISEMNCLDRWKTLTSIVPPENSVVLFASDFSLIPLALAEKGVQKVYCVEENSTAQNVLKNIIKYNNLEDKVIVLNEYDKEFLKDKIDTYMSEPYFRKSIYPWDNLRSIFMWEMLVPESQLFFPHEVRIVSVAMTFSDLHKIKNPLGAVEGFDLRSFDDLVERSSEKSDSDVETQPLWEYPGVAISGPAVLYEFQPAHDSLYQLHESEGSFNIKRSGECHGVALWVDYIGQNIAISGAGPLEYIVPGKTVRWDRSSRQGVYLFRRPIPVEEGQTIDFTFSLNSSEGKIDYTFKPREFAHQEPIPFTDVD